MSEGIRPQPGPQELFLSSSADIAIYGGAAGAGKTFAILLETMRHCLDVPQFSAVIFRRTMPQIKNPGGLWDASMKLYPLTGAEPTANVSEWHWPNGGKVKMSHLQHESDKFSWQGSEIPLIIFDEITHFTEGQFFYMLSRNRSTCGVRPYIRGTTNPDADSWVARFIAWWIDPETGFPIPERAGVVRWFVRINDIMLWGDSRGELVKKHGDPNLPDDHHEQVQPKSVTFVPGKLTDNQELMRADPGYLANLKAMPLVEQARLLGGNWKIRPSSGLYFKRDWCKLIHRTAVPTDLDIVRYWDLAATEKTDSNDPDWTVGVKLGRSRASGLYYWLDTVRIRTTPLGVKTAIKMTAIADGRLVRIGLPQDPGQAGKSQAQDLILHLDQFMATARPERGDKIVRFGPFSAQCQAGNVFVVEGAWNEDAFTALEAFPEPTAHDDDVDGCSGAYQMLNEGNTGLLDFYREEAAQAKAAEVPQWAPSLGGSVFQQAFG